MLFSHNPVRSAATGIFILAISEESLTGEWFFSRSHCFCRPLRDKVLIITAYVRSVEHIKDFGGPTSSIDAFQLTQAIIATVAIGTLLAL